MERPVHDPAADKHILDWDESDVYQWFSSLGYSQYGEQIKEHKIQGDSLCMLDSDGLKAFGITTVGQRLSILKSIYHLKIAHNIPFGEDDYIPPSEAFSSADVVSLEQIHSTIKEQANRLRTLEEDNRTLALAMRSFSDEIIKLRSTVGSPDENPNQIRKRVPYLSNEMEAAGNSLAIGDETARGSVASLSTAESSTLNSIANPSGRETPDNFPNNTKVSLDDPTWKVLPAALKKHRINTDEWPNYAMFISFGPANNRTKRKLELEEKPLYLFKKLKEAQKNPAFVLKNMKEPRTPAVDETPLSRHSPNKSNVLTPASSANRAQGYPTPPLSRSSPGF
ncbi:Sexual differentiation protein ste4 [Psilocybe cubensis]|uniref:Sexual differentiation protein ste4 n=2 Tax=Psilocybe cubensis TaxID=181762 RepID=A0ACB8GWV0_PSICU|nr:Sexual differentiation protein ste4 [Psilocybe cubensis]KAH9479494.1 Sexual differentiation protein ste4 [Psilocybe cubensis]